VETKKEHCRARLRKEKKITGRENSKKEGKKGDSGSEEGKCRKKRKWRKKEVDPELEGR